LRTWQAWKKSVIFPVPAQLGPRVLPRLAFWDSPDECFSWLVSRFAGRTHRFERFLIESEIEAPVMLWDEPASHLDIKHQLGLYRLAQVLAAEGRTVVMVCHDLFLAPLFVDEAVLMKAGSAFAAGSTAEVLCPANLSRAFSVNMTLNWSANDNQNIKLRLALNSTGAAS
jgi:iron complex transport system ATP-binding protein